MATTLPWAVAGVAFLALFAMLAGKGLQAKRGSEVDAPQNALPNPALDGGSAAQSGGDAEDGSGTMAAPFAGGSGGAVRAPNISNMSPSEITDRLFNKIMLLNTQGKTDSVRFFAPMAIQAYQMLGQQQGHPYDLDQRYHLGRIAAAAGALPFAKAQADTMLQQAPDHLLGLILAAQVAKLAGDTQAAQEDAKHFARVKQAQLAKHLPEYEHHQSDIDGGIH